MAQRKWHAVDVEVQAMAVEAVESAFNILEALGTEADSLGKKANKAQIVTGFFDDLPSEEELRRALADSLEIDGLGEHDVVNISYRTVEETDWLAEWKKHWKPTEAGPFLVAPTWFDGRTDGKILITIEPNMAFGTGTHDTTKLCLAAIGEHYRPEWSMLDIGTGTGILSIAAAKLGGIDILACDTDEPSVAIARDNAEQNGVDTIEFFDGSLTDDIPVHDMICANLTLDVIAPILDLLIAKTGKVLLLSGILAEQEPEIVKQLGDRGIDDAVISKSGEWISVLIRR